MLTVKQLLRNIKNDIQIYRKRLSKTRKQINNLKRKIRKTKIKVRKTRSRRIRSRYLSKLKYYRRIYKRRVKTYRKKRARYYRRISYLKEKILTLTINSSLDLNYLQSILGRYKRAVHRNKTIYIKRKWHVNRKIHRLKIRHRKTRSRRLKRRYKSLIGRYRRTRRKYFLRYRIKRSKYYKIITPTVKRIQALNKRGSSPNLKSNVGVFMNKPYSELPSLEKSTGKKLDIFLWYQSISENFDVNLATWLWNRGTKIQLAFEPHNFLKDANNQPEYRLKTITNGSHDGDIYKWARQIKSFGHPVYFRPMSEMNGNWTSWGGEANGNSPGDYIPAWRHIHNIFKQVGANNAMFVWSPNADGNQSTANVTFLRYYPGNDYVDYVGINGYNWGRMYNTPTWTSRWQNFSEVFGSSYKVYTKHTSKPLMISEMASTEVGGSKASWVKDSFLEIRYNYPRIKNVVWFNVNKETDWRINNSSANLNAFIKYAF